ncbi:XrtA/PEP-CTERM system TPR-repeat protein PrsT [Rugamonas rubra]|uniref:Putative PEP-CTERM system TPR-repeat lipoprotein n=1 Tax=Rugamonas rubra TaxID=758825 RepID=A0A1I4R5U2_9BURK|nr:XrtA/PEP-CTERM system TPR-repeat protein PrsT [Rugamonas rubra]SFM47672.1 putative PEP-CTERM system TPR-repeat lipoprotein [Rugamonas rubra]
MVKLSAASGAAPLPPGAACAPPARRAGPPGRPRRPLRCWPLAVLAAALALSGCARHDGAAQMAQARQYQQQGKTRAAIIEMKNVLQQESGNGAARLLLGELYLDTGDVLSADKELRRALALGAPKPQVLPALGRALLQQGQFEQLDALLADTEAQPVYLVLRGNAALGRNQIEPAAKLFEQALRGQPGHAGALLGQARLALARRQPQAALLLVEQALQGNPDEPDHLRLKGDLLRLQGDSAGALLAYQRIVRLRPEQAQAQVDIANLHLQAGRIEQAKAALALARKAGPGQLLVVYTQALIDFREGRLAASLDQLQQVLRVAPEHMPSVLLCGAVQLGLGAYQQAEQQLARFLAANPGQVYASKLMATVALKNGAPEQALQLLEPLLEPAGGARQGDVELLTLAGEAYMQGRKFDKAAAAFEQASALAPQAAMLHAALGVSRIGMGESGRAIAELERAASLEPKGGRAGVLLVLTHLRAKDYPKALAAVKQMERQQGGNPLVHNLKGGVLLASRDVAGARASFEHALTLDPLYLPALENLAQLDTLEKHPELARQRYEAALRRAPKNAAILGALAKLATAQGKPAEARVWLERAARDNPEALAPAMLLAHFYLRSGEQQKALVQAQKLQASNPGNADALALLAEAQTATGQLEPAADSMAKLALLQPASAAVQMRLSTAQLSAGDIAGAVRSLRKALALQPDLPQAQAALVQLLTAQAGYAPALALAREVQRGHAEAPLGYKLEGDVLLAQKRPEAALALYQRAFGLAPSGPLLIPLHGALKAMGRTAQGNARLRDWLAQHPADQPTRLHLASSLLADKDYPAAREQFERILRDDPANVIALNDLAWLYQQQNDGRAVALAERAYKLAPATPAVLDTLGWILAERGEHARALPLLRLASERAPEAGEIRYHLGMSLLKSGDRRGARSELEKVLAGKDFGRRDEVKEVLTRL